MKAPVTGVGVPTVIEAVLVARLKFWEMKEPWLEAVASSEGAPVIKVSPAKTTEEPKTSEVAPEVSENLAYWVQVEPERVKA